MNFNGEIFSLDLSSSITYKEKKSYIDYITANGGRVSFVLNAKVKFLIRDDKLNLDTYKCRQAFKLGIPIVDASYLSESIQNRTVKIEKFFIKNKKIEENLKKGIITSDAKGN